MPKKQCRISTGLVGMAIVVTLGLQAAHATVVVPDQPAFDPDPPDWKAEYGVFHQVVPPTGVTPGNPGNSVNPFHNAGISGAGVSIGVISDGDTATEAAIENLIKAIAPDATVAFENGFNQGQTTVNGQSTRTPNGRPTRANISAAIQAHESNGVDIIVDGASFLTEPFFNTNSFDSTVGQAVRDARNAGTHYFAAAGDLNRNVYQSQWTDFGSTPLGNIHKFSNDGNDRTLTLEIAPRETASFALQWQSTNRQFANLDLALFVDGNHEATSERHQQEPVQDVDGDGVDDVEPWEILSWENDSNSPLTVELAILDNPVGDTAAELKPTFKLIWAGAEVDTDVENVVSPEVGNFDAPTIFGHALDAIILGSMNSDDADDVYNGTVSGNSASADETSSHLADNLGQLPFFIAPDLWEVDVDGEAKDLDGTVISAAWTGALAALMIEQADKMGVTLTDAQIEQFLIDAAIDIEGAGFDSGSGHGLIDPDQVFSRVEAIPEPTTAALLVGGAGLALIRRRRRA